MKEDFLYASIYPKHRSAIAPPISFKNVIVDMPECVLSAPECKRVQTHLSRRKKARHFFQLRAERRLTDAINSRARAGTQQSRRK